MMIVKSNQLNVLSPGSCGTGYREIMKVTENCVNFSETLKAQFSLQAAQKQQF